MSEKNRLTRDEPSVTRNRSRMTVRLNGTVLQQGARLLLGLTGGAVLAALMGAGAPEHRNTTGDQRQVDRGRYVVKIAGCNDCHTAGYAQTGGSIKESQWLMGDRLLARGVGHDVRSQLAPADELADRRAVDGAGQERAATPADAMVVAA